MWFYGGNFMEYFVDTESVFVFQPTEADDI